ncbi:dienelactone hydrolase family protein [Mucilaginibacter aquariorum]|uniref:Dienelactone hydrolase family protein n=1 Tax=Mucilaginibacter aquariorum TaxID=2967225 RepID=A0ABT1TAW1_9SPHI|nr:dienelactone hydrolase family protein [Mucilaginibacter aquariorum]MCQ6961567.1 dienelactone hydrolase family protein [Mucilaginibacter aquariorum]
MEILYQNQVSIPAGIVRLKGDLFIPKAARAIIIFSHGSGSSRFSKRNQHIAKFLQGHGFGTLLFDLLTAEEDQNYYNRFAIDLLKERLIAATVWLEKLPVAKDLPTGYFGASTGAASALKAAARLPEIFAVVCRGGRPDLAREELPSVQSPTLLIVGNLDPQVLQFNQEAFKELECEKHLEVVDGATHLFEEPGTLEKVAELAAGWFNNHIPAIMV